jgi:hypothetical protein
MPARTQNDFLAGFLFGETKENLKADKMITVQNDQRNSNKKQDHRRRHEIETTNIEEERDDRKEVTVLHETSPKRKEKSTFSWFEEFTVEWSETLIHKRQKNTEKGNNDEHLRGKLIT